MSKGWQLELLYVYVQNLTILMIIKHVLTVRRSVINVLV